MYTRALHKKSHHIRNTICYDFKKFSIVASKYVKSFSWWGSSDGNYWSQIQNTWHVCVKDVFFDGQYQYLLLCSYSLLLRQPSETCKRLYMYYRRFFRGFHQHRTIWEVCRYMFSNLVAFILIRAFFLWRNGFKPSSIVACEAITASKSSIVALE